MARVFSPLTSDMAYSESQFVFTRMHGRLCVNPQYKAYLIMCQMYYFFSPDDFKPQSVDSTKPGHLKVTDDEVNVSLPVVSQVHVYFIMVPFSTL